MAAVIVLLLLGTQLLDWHWLVLLPAGTVTLGIWRTRRRLPPPYSVAQIVDRRLRLADTISTALYFATTPAGAKVPRDVLRAQNAQAERLIEGIRISEAIPFTMPRGMYVLAVLGLAASSLFALRYGLDRRLELRKPLARILQQALGLDREQAAAVDKKKTGARRPDLKQMEGLSVGDENQPGPGQLEASPESTLDGNSEKAANERDGQSSQAKSQSPGQEKSEGDEADNEASDEAAGASAGADQNSKGSQGDSKDRQGQQSAAKDAQEGSPGGNSSLMSKFKDAMQNLLSRMRQQPAGGQGQSSQQARGQNARQGKQQPGEGNQNGNRQGQRNAGQESQQEGQSGDDAQSAENASGRGSSQGAEEQNTKQPGSGIGRQDGAKDVKLAEQQAAMGKISEIIGKRSANVTGEVTVEVRSNDQRLQTPYSRHEAAHAETTAEINRDEVPVALEAYVQQYFEQVRKADSAKAHPSRP
jgi:hypothetical protein